MARTLLWTGATSDSFGVAGNWNDLTNTLDPAAAPPSAIDTATIATTQTVTGPGAALNLTLGNEPTLAGTITLGGQAVVKALLTLAPAAVLDAASLTLGSNAALTLHAAARVALTGTAPDGQAALAIGDSSAANAVVLLDGPAARLDAGRGAIVVGNFGAGTLAVTAGGTALASGTGYTDDEPAMQIGAEAGGVGAVTVDGAASLLDLTGEIDVGVFGSGSLGIGHGGTVAVTGTLPNTLPGIAIGDDLSSASGTVAVTGTGALLNAGNGRISIGNIGSGTLLVTQGATALASAAGYTSDEEAVHLGFYAGGVGVATIDGAGSTLAANGAILVGDAGDGTLQISNGGRVSAGGTRDGGIGLVVNAGDGSGAVIVSAGTLTVSDNAEVNGAGTMDVASGGEASIAGVLLLGGGVVSVGTDASVAVGGAAPVAGALAIAHGGQVGGTGTILGNVADDGELTASRATLDITGTVSGTGTLDIDAGATVRLGGGARGAAIVFAGAGGTLVAGSPSLVGSVIQNFQPDSAIVLTGAVGATMTSASAGGTTTLQFNLGGSSLGTLTLAGTPAVAFDSATGTVTACFARGTRIATERGDVPVEQLQPGDRVRLARAPDQFRPVRWIGWRELDLARHPRPQDVMPVRVRAHAFGPGQPARDLRLSPDHAVFAGGALIPVRYLLNGATVAQECAMRITYFHVELDRHDVILAEGLACETYLDTGNRSAFSNHDGAVALHPQFGREAQRRRGCLRLVKSGPVVRGVRSLLLERLLPLGFALTADPGLGWLADGQPVAAQRQGVWWILRLPPGARRLCLCSRRMRPADLDPTSQDWRELGVALLGWRLDGADMPLHHRRFRRGWLAPEDGLRWSTGDAELEVAGSSAVAFRFGDWPRYLRGDRRPDRPHGPMPFSAWPCN